MTAQPLILSVELQAIKDRLVKSLSSGADLSPMEQLVIASELGGLIQLAALDELELQTFRLIRQGKRGRTIVEQLATDAMGNMMLGNEKVVRPDFGRGKR